MNDHLGRTFTVSGRQRIADAFSRALSVRTAALMPYFTLGYPDRETSLAIIEAIAPYSDLLELGVPFSDPIADGPTIQRSTQFALEKGTTSSGCLDMLSELRQRGVKTPVLLMGYYNPILAFGEERYVEKAAEAGADGLIIPDLPPEESEAIEQLAVQAGIAMIHFLAPTSNEHRVEQVLQRANGFIYLVSVTGVTGARQSVDGGLAELVFELKSKAQVPVAVGFGISTAEQASMISRFADGIIVGSAIIDAVDKEVDKPMAAELFVKKLQEGLNKSIS